MKKDKNVRVFKKDKNFKTMDLGDRAVFVVNGKRLVPGANDLTKILNKIVGGENGSKS